MFSVGDRIAHPMHGAGVIDSIVKRKVGGEEREYYVLKLPVGDMLVMIPVESTDAIGVRPIIEPDEAENIINSIAGIEINMTQNWNKRYRENMLKIKSGDLMEVATVIKGL
ncbi:MAG: CarD family transcriptional regulator, partial [Oscillospiraceae bacterium]